MSSIRGRGRGGPDRGQRGSNTPRGPSSFRGGRISAKTNGDNGTNPTTTTPFAPRSRAADRGGRGAFRGGANTNIRGRDASPRGSSRGRRGNYMTHTNVFATSTSTSNGVSNTTPFAQDEYQKRFDYLKEHQKVKFKAFVKDGLMNPEEQINLKDAVDLRGICQDMCPEYERVRRIVEKDLKVPENTAESLLSGKRSDRVPDESRMVKQYQRSAAGNEVELVSDIRSPSACLKSMKYMMERLDHEDLEFLQGWIWDRTRAVRKDLRTQVIDKPEDFASSLECFEQNARYHLISLHYMSRSTNDFYSHQQDFEQLNSTVIDLKEAYPKARGSRIVSPNEAEFQAYRVILALHTKDHMIENEINTLPAHLQQNRRVQIALQILQAGKAIFAKEKKPAVARQNWRGFWNLIRSPSVSYLMACAAEVSFQAIRTVVLDGICRAYRQPGRAMQDLTISTVSEMLGLETEEEARHFCEQYKLFFGVRDDGEAFLDINPTTRLISPDTLKPQLFSSIVESKRFDRSLSAVIQGLSVSEAHVKGLIVESEATDIEAGAEAEDSLFIPETTTKSADSTVRTNSSGFPSGPSTNTTPKLNPFANPFQMNSTPSIQPVAAAAPSLTKSNPFTQEPKNPFASSNGSNLFPKSSFGLPSGLSTPSSSQTPVTATAPMFPAANPVNRQSIPPGTFDPSKNAIKFSPSTNGTSFFSSAPPATAATTTTASTKSALTTSPAQWQFPGASTIAGTQDQAPRTSPFHGVTMSAAGSPTPVPAPGINLASTTAQKSLPNGLPTFSFTTNPDVSPMPSKESTAVPPPLIAQNDQAEQQRKVQEEQQRRAREEQERIVREQRERREKEERERLARQEQERRVREEQLRLADEKRRQEALAKALEEQRNAAYDALTESVFLDPMEGLLPQYVDQQVRIHFPIVKAAVEQEEAEKLAGELYERRQLAKLRMFCGRWMDKVIRKKRAGRARSRRQWLKEHEAEILEALQQDQSRTVVDANVDSRRNDFKKPIAPASANRIEKLSKSSSKKDKGKAIMSTAPLVRASSINGRPRQRSYATANRYISPSYKDPTAPIDQTETDWFKLRAMGIDPSKYRKRSHDSDSDEDIDQTIERKRMRTSTSSLPRTSSQASAHSLGDDDIYVRFNRLRAGKETLKNPSAPSFSRSTRGTPKPTNDLIAQARALLSATPTPKQSPPDVQHGSSRSAADLTLRNSSGNNSTFRQSNGTPVPLGKPAYWGRTSRFVPQHLYGKGPEAISEYFGRSRGTATDSDADSVKSLQLSSPIPTSQPYYPPQDAEYGNDESEDVEEDEEMASGEEYDEEEEQEVLYDDEEEEQEVLYDDEDGMYYDEGEEEEGDEVYGLTYEDQQNTQSTPGPGATQDDAIELSD